MLWNYFSVRGVRNVAKIYVIMNNVDFVKSWTEICPAQKKKCAWRSLSSNMIITQSTFKKLHSNLSLKDQNDRVPTLSLYLAPIENMWNILDEHIDLNTLTNKESFWKALSRVYNRKNTHFGNLIPSDRPRTGDVGIGPFYFLGAMYERGAREIILFQVPDNAYKH